jgi:hypothetical protein
MAMPHAARTALPAPSQASNHDEVTNSAAASSSADAARCDSTCEPWLEVVLRQVAQRGGGDGQLVVALLFVGQPAEHVAAEAINPVHPACVGGRLCRGTDGFDVDTDLAPHLERAGVQHMRSRGTLRPWAAVDDAYRVAEFGEQHGCGEAHRAGADDQQVDGVRLSVGHQKMPANEPPSRWMLWPEMYPACAEQR